MKKLIGLILFLFYILMLNFPLLAGKKLDGQWNYIRHQKIKQGNYDKKNSQRRFKKRSNADKVSASPSFFLFADIKLLDGVETGFATPMQGKKFLLSYSFSHKKGFCFFILSSLLFNMIRGASTGNCNGENCVISPTSTTYNYQQDALSSFQAFTNAKVTPYKDKSLKVGELRYGEDNNILWQIFEEEKLSRIVELATVDVTTTVKMKCEKVLKHAGWYHDDLDKKSYEINKVFAKRGEEEREFLGIFEQSDLGLPYKIDRTFFKNEGDIILENGIPKKITGTVYTVYSRKDDTEYEVKDISRDHPLEIKHVSFSHNREANKSYQIVKLSIIHQNTPYIIEKGYKISGIPYPHQYSLVKWEDDMNGHISTKFEKVFINTNQPKALDEGNIPEQDRIVDNIIKTQTQEHQKLWNIPGSWILPGNNYRIPHSGLEYR